MPRMLKHPLDIALFFVAIVSIAGVILGHEDPFARDIFCARSAWCPQIANAKAWEKISYDLSIGALTSLIFYILIVRIPDYQKRRRYKKSLAQQYRVFREDTIGLILGVADGTYDAAMPEELLDQKKFKEYFKMKVGQGQDRWDRFCNKLDPYLKEIVKRMEIFRDEISFILNNVDIPSDEPKIIPIQPKLTTRNTRGADDQSGRRAHITNSRPKEDIRPSWAYCNSGERPRRMITGVEGNCPNLNPAATQFTNDTLISLACEQY